jgi:hypothetical protein
MNKHASTTVLGCFAFTGAALGGPSCTTSTTTACATDAYGNYTCASYASAYPYDYTYVDPLYTSSGGYYPYSVDTYYDPYGYTTVIYGLTAAPRVDAGFRADAAAPRFADAAAPSPVDGGPRPLEPELLDKAHRAADDINYGVRAALDPVKDLIKTKPQENSNNVVFGPANHANGNYQFTVTQLSSADKRYGWKLEARPMSSNGSFTLVAGGLITVGDTPRRGKGVVGIDCGAMAAADSSLTCQGKLLIGFDDHDNDTKVLNVGVSNFTPDPNMVPALTADVSEWRQGTQAIHVRLAAKTNLAETATSAPESVVLKLFWMQNTGVRVDAIATGGDVPAGQVLKVDTCVPADLNQSEASTSAQLCNTDGTNCLAAAGSATAALTCPAGMATADEPNSDPTAFDPPSGAPQMPAQPTAIPNGQGM